MINLITKEGKDINMINLLMKEGKDINMIYLFFVCFLYFIF